MPRVIQPPAVQPNERWSIDFLRDSLADGRPFRVFTVVDNVTKVSPAIAFAAVILPVYAKQVYGTSVSLGVLFAGASVGTLVGSLCYTALALRLSRLLVLIIGIGLTSATFWLLLPFPPLAVAAGAIALRGLATGFVAPLFGLVPQERVPAALRGRVFGTSQAVGMLAVPLGTLLAGFGIAIMGLRGTLLGMGLFALAAVVPMLVTPVFRELRTAPSHDATSKAWR